MTDAMRKAARCAESTHTRPPAAWALSIVASMAALDAKGWASSPPPRYTVRLMETLPGFDVRVTSLNESGIAAGTVYWSSGTDVEAFAAYWDKAGVLHLLNEGSGQCCPEANGINEVGEIAGRDEFDDAVVWIEGEPIKLGEFDSDNGGLGMDVNDRGQACGSDDTETGTVPFLWEEGLLHSLVLVPGAQNGSANAINNLGQMAGSCGNACLWLNPDEVIDLGNLGGGSSTAWDLNDRTQVVGRSYLKGTSRTEAFLWEDGVMTPLPIDPTVSASAHAINNRGWIVGSNGMPSLWIDGVQYDIQDLAIDAEGMRIDAPDDINDRGQLATTVYIDGDLFPAILTPVFELLEPSPGRSGEVNTLAVEGAVPGHRVYFLYSLQSGSRNVPRCPGVQVDLAAPTLIGSDVANRFGVAKVEALVPSQAAGRLIHIQAVDAMDCVVTEPLDFTFE